MQTLKRSGLIPKALRFTIVGAGNTAIGLTVIYALTAIGASTLLANVFGYLCGLSVSFVLNKQWTFQHSGDTIASALRFLAVFAIAYSCNLTTVFISLNIARANHYVAQASGVLPYVLVFYLGSSYFTFRSKTAREREAA